MSGSSDGGAHLASFVGADYTTKLITDHVPGILSLEEAIWRLTGMPAAVHGLVDRGTLRVGAKADVTIFDPERLEAGEHFVAAGILKISGWDSSRSTRCRPSTIPNAAGSPAPIIASPPTTFRTACTAAGSLGAELSAFVR